MTSMRTSRAELPSAEDSDGDAEFCAAVIAGLSSEPKALPSKYLYDKRGSKLFDEICTLPEYYLTRVETGLLREHADAMVELIGDGVLVEFGSGASSKVRILLDAARQLSHYVPVDISREHLLQAAKRLAADYPALSITPVFADYTQPFVLPRTDRWCCGFFPGSTIGNFQPAEATTFLARMAALLGEGSGLLIGVDLQKDESILLPAYDDAQGVTAAFNRNLLRRINRELAGDIDLDTFAHEARFNPQAGKIEMHLRSLKAQTVRAAGGRFAFAEGETIHTEDSHKYTLDGFRALAERAGWTPVQVWVDPDRLFSIHFLRAKPPSS